MAVSTIKLTAVVSSLTAIVAALPTVTKTSATVTNLTPTVNTTPAKPAVANPTRLGVNVSGVTWWSNERSFMNLMAGGYWQDSEYGWQNFDPTKVDLDGNVLVEPGHMAATGMTTPPRARFGTVSVKCTWLGEGTVRIFGGGNWTQQGQTAVFDWRKGDNPLFIIQKMNLANPMKNIDCREADADAKAVFDPNFVNSLRPYNTVRFLEWQLGNQNYAATWAKRTGPNAMFQGSRDGVAVEHMVALANAAHVNPYFTMPFNSDADYMRRFAQYVHDNLDKTLVAYVEIGNEVWNFSFPSAQQAFREGYQVQKLDTDGNTARMRYYGQKIIDTMTIWESVYKTADDRKRLARVAAGQAAWPELFENVLLWKDTGAHVDVVAFAPYFGNDGLSQSDLDAGNVSGLLGSMQGSFDVTDGWMQRDLAIAKRWNKRMITYEAGTHIMNYGSNNTVLGNLNRDSRFGDVYKRYLNNWASKYGDLMILYQTVAPISNQAAFGLAEYSGQAMAETPKRKAALEFAAVANR